MVLKYMAGISTLIGEPGVFLPQPPHQPACGAAPGGSQSLPGRSRVTDFHPELFDRQKPLSLEPLVGHVGLGSEGASRIS
jgi:hypothetical protein